jgi:dihydrolipoamide dehydrogenase
MEYDVVVIGGGPGGYVAAIKASHFGLKVALVERDKVGGTCLLRGCIPTKTLIASAHVLHTLRRAEEFGIHLGGFSIHYEKMKARKDAVVKELCQGVTGLVTSHGVKLIEGTAEFLSPHEIKVRGKESIILRAKNVIIATGSIPGALPMAPIDGNVIHDSTSILEMTTLPNKLIVLGAGYIGCEFASLFAELGVSVTMVEFLPTIVFAQGKTISHFLSQAFHKIGIELRCNVSVQKCQKTAHGVTLSLSDGSTIDGDALLVSVGRQPFTEGLHLGNAGIATDAKGFISVNDKMETGVPNIYAIGDVTGKAMLAHVASHQGIVAAENIAGHKMKMNYAAVPAVIFTTPEIATVGLTMDSALKMGYDAKSTIFPFQALGKAKAEKHTEGYAEIISVKGTGQILGAAMCGHEAGNMIASMTLAIAHELTLESIAETIHAHPTLAESWMEAAHFATGYPIHLPPIRK